MRVPKPGPLLSFYGSKWRLAPKYPRPNHRVIVEPFAGGAGFSLRCNAMALSDGRPLFRAVLVEKDPVLAAFWRWITRATEDEILSLPLLGPNDRISDLDIRPEARTLIGFWVNSAGSTPCDRFSKWAISRLGSDPVYFWSARCRARVATSLRLIRGWRVIEGDYTRAPDINAYWFIDPPYQDMGRYYRHGSDGIDYDALARWCRSRTGTIVVCENHGASWLPFRRLCVQNGARCDLRRRRTEVAWIRP